MRSSRVGLVAVAVLLSAFPLAAQSPFDYSVYFWPDPKAPPEKMSTAEGTLERQFAIVYNAGPNAGTHSYKLLLRAFRPDGTLACETTTIVEPWTGIHTMKKVVAFQALYGVGPKTSTIIAGKYLLGASLTEQIPPGEARQDTAVNNNQYPFEPPQYVPVEFGVRAGASEVQCIAASRPPFIKLPPGFKVPQPVR